MWADSSTPILTTSPDRAHIVIVVEPETTDTVERCAVLIMATLMLSGCGGHDADAPQSTEGPATAGIELHTDQQRYSADADLPRIVMLLRNNDSRPCSLPSSPKGSVEILSVHRDGSAVLGVPARLDLYSGMADVVADSLRSVAPGESITVPLSVERGDDGTPVVISTNESNANNARTTTWPLRPPGKYQLTARLSLPEGVEHSGLPEMCEPPDDPATVGFEVAP